MADIKLTAGIDLSVNAGSAKSQLNDLQKQLQQISNMDLDLKGTGISEEIQEASKAAMELQSHLKAATNISTGNLDFTKLNTSLKQSGVSLEEYGRKLISLGPEGQKAFMSLSTAISNSEIQVTKSSKLLNTAFDNLKKTIGWQLSSSIVNSFSGAIQTAVGYAKDLNQSLTDIRIVTGASTEQMATFAREANKAAKNLSTTTTDYTKASLIYYQQGLSEAEVRERTETTIKMANVTGQSAQTVSDQMTAIWNNYDNGTKSLTHYADVMTALGAATASSSDEIAEGLQKFASISDTVGLSYEYAASALATITATSRESADVVGNSLKTLFSRIQGLQLGETLDDGTTLNKYSTAMAKVGISIKDSSGELKDMDTILDEMGNTWQTLASDEKMALAQTVAGVRQYTQLMTLMENWDEFKSNVNIANSSEGTLDSQAAIYAQSWEAASNRMRTAFEGLWDNLINSDSAIGFLDFFTNVISGIDGLVSSLGGAKGTLLTFGGLFTKLFGDNIANNVREIAGDVQKMLPSYKTKQEEAKRQRIAELSKAADEQFGKGSARSETMKKIATAQMQEDATRDQRYAGLSEQEKELLKAQENKVKAARNQQLAGAELIDAGREQVADAVTDHFNQIDLGKTYKGGAKVEKANFTDKDKADLQTLREKENREGLDASEVQQIKELAKKEKKASSSVDSSFYNQRQTRGEVLKNISKSNDDFLASINKALNERSDDVQTSDFIASLKTIAENNKINHDEFVNQLDKIMRENNELTNADVERVAQNMASQRSADVVDDMDISESAPESDEEEANIREGYKKYSAGQDKQHQGKRMQAAGEKTEAEVLDAMGDGPEGADIKDWAGALVDAAEGLMSAAAAGESINALVNSFQNGTATFSSALTSVLSATVSAANGFQSLQSALSAIPGISMGAANGISLLITAILALGSTVMDWADDVTVSYDELIQNLQNSNNNLQTAEDNTESAIEAAKIQNEDYLEGIEKIKSFNSDPVTLAEDIFESNKKAYALINEYGLKDNQYSTDSNGLIEIDEAVLRGVEANKESVHQISEYANLLGTAINNQNKVEANTTQALHEIASGNSTIDSSNFAVIDETMGQYFEKYGTFDDNTGRYEINEASMLDIYQSGQWDEFKQAIIDSPSIYSDKMPDNLTSKMMQYDKEYAPLLDGTAETQSNIQLDNAALVIANKILGENGINRNTQEGYNAYAKAAANEIVEGGYLNEWLTEADVNNIKDNRQAQTEISRLLEEQGWAKNAGNFYAKDGNIYYKEEGSTEEAFIERQTLNAWKAAENVANNSRTIIKAAADEWDAATKKYVDGAADAGLNIEKLGTVSGASANSVKTLFESASGTGEKAQAARDALSTLTEDEQTRINKIFNDGIVSALNLDPATLSEVSMGTLETLQNQADAMGEEGATAIGQLFEGLKNATDAETAEDFAKIITAISSLDFDKNAQLNLIDLQTTLEAFGFNVDTGGLEALYAILVKLAGLGPGGGLEDLADTNTKLTNKRGDLNDITPGGEVDGATMQAAKDAGLTGDFVKTGDDKYTYNGTQEDIDGAKSRLNRAFADNQAKIDSQQAKYSQLQDAGLDMSGNYQDAAELAEAFGLDYFYDPQAKTNFAGGSGNNNLALVANELGYEPGELRDLISSDPQKAVDMVNEFLSNSTMTDKQQSAGVEDFMANITSTNDMMGAINDAQGRKDTAGFLDANGVISDEAIARLETLPATSERAAGAISDYTRVAENLKNLNEEADANKDGQVSDEEAESYNSKTENLLAETEATYAAAEAEAYLQSQIDEVAAARGLDADVIAGHVETFRSKISKLTNEQEKIIESTNDYNKRLMALAVEYEENSEGLADLQSAYKDYNSAAKSGNQQAQTKAWENMRKAIAKITKLPLNKVTNEFMNQAKAAGILEKALKGDVKAITELEDLGRMEALTDATTDVGKALQNSLANMKGNFGEGIEGAKNFVSQLNSILAQTDMGQMISEVNSDTAKDLGTLFDALVTQFGGGTEGLMQAAKKMNGLGIGVKPTDKANSDVSVDYSGTVTELEPDGYGGLRPKAVHDVEQDVDGAGAAGGIQFYDLGGGGGSPGGGGGGGGGGGPKEPKKVANKRKSQTVKRYKRNDAKRSSAEKSKKSAENQKDYLYGESKIAQMEKINKLAQKEANITSDRIKESRKYLVEDRENLIKYMQKYGFEAEFEADGFLANYEKAWTKIYEEIAALYEDNLLTEEEEKIEEDLNIKLEELEGALEDYENSLSELADDIEKWEESMYEMFDLEIEQMEHKVEFKLELDEDSLKYIDFLIENLGDSAVRAIDRIELIADKTDYLFSSIDTAYQGIQDIYALSDSPLHLFATGGIDIDGLLTESQVEAFRGQADTLIDIADQLREIRDTIQEQVSEVFDMWTEKINHNLSALEQYGSVMEYFKNIVDLTGNDIFGLSTNFIRQMESAQIDQSIDQMEANKAYYEQLQEMRANVEYELQKAQMSGDEERIAYWEEHLRTLDEEMQSAQDSMLSSLENTLTMISEQFTAAMEDAVEAFNESIYSSGGLEGLSTDYSLLREEADLMAEDYDKIYQLSKISRNINKTLDDTKIIAGKQRLNGLLSEINDLQASGVEMSKYDLEYLEAKYQLYLAQIELENSQHDKDTVRLSKDSEGNWSYVYTTNEEKVNEAQQKYEDALYEMQNKNHEYLDEMSSSVIDLTKQMNDEISNLEISDFANLEEYNARVEEIQQKYLAQIERRENELNKAITNNQDLYDKDWKAYSEMTGYKISADKNWIDSFKETTLGYLTESESVFSDFGTRITEYAATLAETLSGAAGSYFGQIEEALGAYDTSIATFGAKITGTYKTIQEQSDLTAQKTTGMAVEMKKAFEDVVTTVGNWQDTDGVKITEMLENIAILLKDIFEAINRSANIKTDSGGPTIGQKKAVELLDDGVTYEGEHYNFGDWKYDEKTGGINIKDGKNFSKKGSNFIDYHAYLVTQVQKALDEYFSDPEDEDLKWKAEKLIKKYWAFRSVIDRVYNIGEIEEPNIPKSFDTGGYTGEWGHEGKLAMLHEKELILNPNDTANFLDALNISRDVIHSMIEMNARASSLGLGNMIASSIKDNTQTIEQTVHITAEFPEATDHNEIEAAFDNLINMASQYAFRSE